ncbi:hypothetical protein HPP92_018626 [Vanilla planifolia]|uniref:RRM domain-containing protein n=1 Tax=Vanilla planifolia TaxID=51239 RepID=A0A835Q629_VANPL|nr:hypothetical protein HPP92_018626 [Vanilla planifolia]
MAIKKTDDSFSCVRSCIRARLHLPVLSLHSARRPLSLSYAALSDENYEEDSSDYDDAGRLFIGNIPFTITTSELARIFSQAGTVNSVEIIPDRFTNRNRGFGFISMATVEDANKAIRMFDGAKIGDRIVKVNFPEVPRTSRLDTLDPFKDTGTPGYIDKGCKLYAGNLRWTVTSEILAEAFSSCSGVLGAKVIYEPLALRSRGFGFVAFASAEESQAALDSMNGKNNI